MYTRDGLTYGADPRVGARSAQSTSKDLAYMDEPSCYTGDQLSCPFLVEALIKLLNIIMCGKSSHYQLSYQLAKKGKRPIN
jgi:hypothetical protein